MTRKQITIETWEPSPAQRRAAGLLAECRSQTEVADIIGIDDRSIRRWWAETEFRAFVRDLQVAKQAGYDLEFAELIADALMVERRALKGDGITPDDPRAKLAHDILSRTAYRIAVQQAEHRASLPPSAGQRQLPGLPEPAA